MKNLINTLTGSPAASASVVDGKLILSFPGAINPVVWQMDLDRAKASALEVQEKNGGFSLVLKNPTGEEMDIAPFDDRSKALQGLMAASRALENAYGQIHRQSISNENVPHVSHYESPKKSKFWPVVITLVVLIALFWLSSSLSLQPPEGYQLSTAGAGGSASSEASEAGVPVSADAFLQGR